MKSLSALEEKYYRKQWEEIRTKLNNSGFDLSKIRLTSATEKKLEEMEFDEE